MQELPRDFIQRMSRQLGDGLSAFLRACEEPPRRGARLNILKGVTALARDCGLGEAIPWAERAYMLAADSVLGATPLHEAGACYLQ